MAANLHTTLNTYNLTQFLSEPAHNTQHLQLNTILNRTCTQHLTLNT